MIIRIKLITYDAIKEKVDALVSGFYSVIDSKIVYILSVDEFDYIVSGQNDIDLEDWKRNTIYKGQYNEHHRVSLFALY